MWQQTCPCVTMYPSHGRSPFPWRDIYIFPELTLHGNPEVSTSFSLQLFIQTNWFVSNNDNHSCFLKSCGNNVIPAREPEGGLPAVCPPHSIPEVTRPSQELSGQLLHDPLQQTCVSFWEQSRISCPVLSPRRRRPLARRLTRITPFRIRAEGLTAL